MTDLHRALGEIEAAWKADVDLPFLGSRYEKLRVLKALEKCIEQRNRWLRYKHSGEAMNLDPYDKELLAILEG